MSANEDEEGMLQLRKLSPVEPPRELSDRVRRRAQLELASATGGTWLTTATRAWMRVGLPVALAVAVVAYLSFAVSSASALYH